MPGPRDDRGVLAARILAEARVLFAEQGSAGTTIRAVARAADVDPALVYHYFRSKEQLLDAATDPPPEMVESARAVWASPPGDLGRNLVRNLVRLWADPAVRPVMQATLMTAAHEPATREKLTGIIETYLVGPAATGLDPEERRARASLVASQLLGLALTRYVWRIEPLASMTDEQVVEFVAPTVQRYVELDVG